MKEKLILVILIFSLTVNAAALITMGYFWGREYGSRKAAQQEGKTAPFNSELSLDSGQRGRMRDLRKSFMNETAPIRHTLTLKRAELASLLASAGTDRASLEQKLREINDLQLKMQTAVIDQLLKERESLTPEQQRRYADIISSRLCQDPLRGGRGPRGYRGRGMMGREEGNRGGMGEGRRLREHGMPDE